MKYPVYTLVLLTLILTGFHFRQPGPITAPAGKLRLVFHHQVGKDPLALGTLCRNGLGDRITIERFKYYVSHFTFTDSKGRQWKPDPQYFLIDEEIPDSKIITIQVQDIDIRQIGFLLGVDSARNVSGIQTGALDPLKGMFWTWNSGYIMAKLEGTAERSPSPGHRFTYHIGGFRFGMNTAREIRLTIPQTSQPVREVHIAADIDRWFNGSWQIDLAETPVCHSPGVLAMRFADNYQNMFSIQSVH